MPHLPFSFPSPSVAVDFKEPQDSRPPSHWMGIDKHEALTELLPNHNCSENKPLLEADIADVRVDRQKIPGSLKTT